ncbi:aminotransferase class IV [uncultured Microbulbifer sp.]|uniref:aminotransferase class IV n=1 Tax=uncultured Microbulbifer sp. TaxID=348147 RepID=UPI0025E6254C|nr:aminotransferase class IV [uncultured Microbulbifer sp.]
MKQAQAIYFANRERVDQLPADADFGPGALETMRLEANGIPLWSLHRARLLRCSAIAPETLVAIETVIQSLSNTCSGWHTAGRVRLRLGRRAGQPGWDLSVVPFDPGTLWQDGVSLVPCTTAFPRGQDNHRGCKTLDRAFYQRAAAELTGSASGESDSREGLLLDADGNVIETLRCNLLLWRAGRWVTPKLERHGVRGVMRDWLLQRLPIAEATVSLEMLCRAEEVALCNSLRGVIPVVSLEGSQTWSRRRETASLQKRIADVLWK